MSSPARWSGQPNVSHDVALAAGRKVLAPFLEGRDSWARGEKKTRCAALVNELKKLAIRLPYTSGKWMLFSDRSYVDGTWETVARATDGGELGPASKVSTVPPRGMVDSGSHVICVYTNGFADEAELRRVLNRMLEVKRPSSLNSIVRLEALFSRGFFFNYFEMVSFPSAILQLGLHPGKSTGWKSDLFTILGIDSRFIQENRLAPDMHTTICREVRCW